MISNQLITKILQKIEFNVTPGQKVLLNKLSDFVINIGLKNNAAFIIKGYAGTGKTSIVSYLVKTLAEIGLKSVLLAPTGRAAKVFSTFAGKTAYTVHKKIYRQKSSKDGFGKFALNRNLHKNTIFIIDEASMISNSSYDASIFGSGRLLDDIIEYVAQGEKCKLILLGDVAQLPPVGLTISPALERKTIENYGWLVEEVELTEVVRQKENSFILQNATQLRNNLAEDNFSIPKINFSNQYDVKRISGEDLIELISDYYDKDGIEETIVVCRSNKRANKYNEGIRRSILWKEDEISIGDLLMVVKNNYFWTDEDENLDFIANGDTFEVTRIKNYEDLYGYRFANITAKFVDYDNYEIDVKIFLDSIYIEKASFSQKENKELYYNILEDYSSIKSRKTQYEKVKNNPYFNALQVKFAYAITCHKAQGGQWKNVFVDLGYFTDDKMDKEYLRWLYTAFTRARNNLFLINFPKQFFTEE
ncbi:MAG: AAA family ATPase [Chlorobi bacterium]|nr:AAA family ATPase [Chlorobiota bacterium]